MESLCWTKEIWALPPATTATAITRLMPPGVDSVANACGTCHGKVAKLFAGTVMKHKFEEPQLPGCSTCHGNHLTLQPSDEMLGNEGNAVCVKCHNPEHPEHGATVAGADTARAMRDKLEELKR